MSLPDTGSLKGDLAALIKSPRQRLHRNRRQYASNLAASVPVG